EEALVEAIPHRMRPALALADEALADEGVEDLAVDGSRRILREGGECLPELGRGVEAGAVLAEVIGGEAAVERRTGGEIGEGVALAGEVEEDRTHEVGVAASKAHETVE